MLVPFCPLKEEAAEFSPNASNHSLVGGLPAASKHSALRDLLLALGTSS